MIIIHSSKFVDTEFEAEVGPIPLCMLPIGNKKILELQVSHFREYFANEKIIVTLPQNYQLTINEQVVIDELSLSVHYICDKVYLAEAVLYVLNVEIDHPAEPIRILQGDRFLDDIPLDIDCIAVDNQSRQRDWCDRYQYHDHELQWLGYFSFSSKANLVKSLALSIKNFSEAVTHYQTSVSMHKVQPKNWYNCSRINSYFDARSNITTQRSFNALNIESGIVTKSSVHDIKIQAEIYWFAHLPPKLKRFTPQFIDSGRLEDGVSSYYCLEFLPFLPLNELYVHGRNPISFWRRIFDLVKDYLSHATDKEYLAYVEVNQVVDCREDLFCRKTLSRLEEYQKSLQVDLHAAVFYQGLELGSILDIAQDCISKTLALPSWPTIMHGDLCFSNMLFDSRGRRLKLIDPRGIDCQDNFSIFGDATYDLAKLTHSMIGMYDFIIAGRFEMLPDELSNSTGKIIHFDVDERLKLIQAEFLQFQFFDGIEMTAIMPAVVLLFLSMLPLHADRPDRQQAMITNAFRLYKTYVYQTDNSQSLSCTEQIYNNDVLER